MDSFHQPAYGLRSQFTVKAMAKKMAKSIVGKSMRSDQRRAPNAPNVLPVTVSERARTGRDGPARPRGRCNLGSVRSARATSTPRLRRALTQGARPRDRAGSAL